VINNSPNPAAQAHEYDQAVRAYEESDRQVDALLTAKGGISQNLSDEEYTHYRELADLRDLAYNRVKTLERGLLDE